MSGASRTAGWQSRARSLLAQGLSPAVVAQRLGLAKWSVERVRRGMQEPAQAVEDLPPAAMAALYESGLTLERLASRTGRPQRQVRRALLAQGVKLRAPGNRR